VQLRREEETTRRIQKILAAAGRSASEATVPALDAATVAPSVADAEPATRIVQ
jgi:hypothetical protein